MKRILLMTAIILFAKAALAQKPVDFTQTLSNIEGTKLTETGPDGKVQPIELWEVAVNALETGLPDDRSLTGVRKFELDQLARRVYKCKSCVLTSDELKTVKDRIGEIYPPLMVGAAWRALDPSLAEVSNAAQAPK